MIKVRTKAIELEAELWLPGLKFPGFKEANVFISESEGFYHVTGGKYWLSLGRKEGPATKEKGKTFVEYEKKNGDIYHREVKPLEALTPLARERAKDGELFVDYCAMHGWPTQGVPVGSIDDELIYPGDFIIKDKNDNYSVVAGDDFYNLMERVEFEIVSIDEGNHRIKHIPTGRLSGVFGWEEVQYEVARLEVSSRLGNLNVEEYFSG